MMKISRKLGSKFAHTVALHPCFSHEAHFKYSRLHLPVAPRCNIQCRYCKRDINKCENRPGTASCILTPLEGLRKVRQAVESCPEFSVVGVAGPGDALANEGTFETLRLIHMEFPHLIKCIATNGLLLPDRVTDLIRVGVQTVTVTINAVNPEIGAEIYEYVLLNGKAYTGVRAARTLITRQVKGVELASIKGLLVKVNTVLIPGLNDEHVVEVAKTVADAGAFKMNIIPLIPLYRFIHHRPPTCEELGRARERCEEYIPQFRLCKLCRADAFGVPGFEKGFAEYFLPTSRCGH